MLPKTLGLALAVALLLGCAPTERDDAYDVTTLVLPAGHPDTGRQTFARLGCNGCHHVSWEPDFDEPRAINRGPLLDARLSTRSTGFVATAITAPSYHVPSVYRERTEARMSPMADFTDALTVRELADVVAYLRTQGGEIEPDILDFEQNTLPHHL